MIKSKHQPSNKEDAARGGADGDFDAQGEEGEGGSQEKTPETLLLDGGGDQQCHIGDHEDFDVGKEACRDKSGEGEEERLLATARHFEHHPGEGKFRQ